MITGPLMATPRPVPSRRLPAAGGSLVVLLALPLFAAAGWSLGAWGLAAGLWVGGEIVAFGIGRLPLGANSLLSSGIAGIAMTFRVVAVMMVLVAVAASNAHFALAAGLVFAAAYSCELALSLLSYFTGSKT
jgi:predicted DNA repair protein MutK